MQPPPQGGEQPAAGSEDKLGSGQKEARPDPFVAQDISNEDLLSS